MGLRNVTWRQRESAQWPCSRELWDSIAAGTELLETQYCACCVVELYNRGRPHSSLGPGVPDSKNEGLAPFSTGHSDPDGHRQTGARRPSPRVCLEPRDP